jgi:hypothetical protein
VWWDGRWRAARGGKQTFSELASSAGSAKTPAADVAADVAAADGGGGGGGLLLLWLFAPPLL